MPRTCYLCDKKKTPKITLHKFPKNEALCKIWKTACDLRDEDVVTNVCICSEHFTKGDYCNADTMQLTGRLLLKPNSVPSVNVPVKLDVVEYVNVNPLDVKDVKPSICDCVDTPNLSIDIDIKDEDLSTFNSDEEPHTPETSSNVDMIDLDEEPLTPETCSSIDLLELGLDEEPSASNSDEEFYTAKQRKCFEPRYLGEVYPSDFEDPGRAKRIFRMAMIQLKSQKRKIEALKSHNQRLQKKIKSLQEVGVFFRTKSDKSKRIKEA